MPLHSHSIAGFIFGHNGLNNAIWGHGSSSKFRGKAFNGLVMGAINYNIRA